MTSYSVAAIQIRSGTEKAANLEAAERLVRCAAAQGANLVTLPEMFNWRGKSSEEPAQAEPLNGPTLTRMSALARELKVYLLAGSIAEQVAGNSKSYNSSALFGPDGARLAVYRKIHLFDVELAGRVVVKESETKLAGGEPVWADTALGRIGLTICYDLRFPELYRRLARAGVTIFTVPSAFTFHTGEAHWEVLLRARAIENQSYVIAPAQFGTNVHGFNDYGNSMIVDPWGRVLGRACDQEGVVMASLDMAYLETVRRELPALAHIRLSGG